LTLNLFMAVEVANPKAKKPTIIVIKIIPKRILTVGESDFIVFISELELNLS
jgi:hypothetical protein